MAAMTNKAIAIVPARGGSKGLPRKNILDLAGKPLITWTIEACLQSAFVNKVIVSSDNDEILEIAKNSGVEALRRPESLATDSALIMPVISHAISTLEEQLEDIQYIVLMQPSSPLRTVNHLDEAFVKLISSSATSLISVTKPTQSLLKSFRIDDGYLKGLVSDSYPFMRRQDLPDTYLANGAIYIVDLNEFKKHTVLLTNQCVPFEMDQESSLDIDSFEDLKAAEALLSG
jgi:CMP-N,N'-diacetyllegionaminic acid synthase